MAAAPQRYDSERQRGGAAATRAEGSSEVTGLALLWFYATLGWCSLIGLIANASAHRLPWRDLLLLGIAGVAGARTVRRTGLLALATRVHGHAPLSRTREWRCWLGYFKLSAATFVLSCVAGWFALPQLIVWLVEPLYGTGGAPFPTVPPSFSSLHELWKTKLMLVLALGVLPVVPMLASDLWRLFTPLMNARVARLRFVFPVATGLVVLFAVLSVRHCTPVIFTGLLSFAGGEP